MCDLQISYRWLISRSPCDSSTARLSFLFRNSKELGEEVIELGIFPVASVGSGGFEALFDYLILVGLVEEHSSADDVHGTPCVEPLELGMEGHR